MGQWKSRSSFTNFWTVVRVQKFIKIAEKHGIWAKFISAGLPLNHQFVQTDPVSEFRFSLPSHSHPGKEVRLPLRQLSVDPLECINPEGEIPYVLYLLRFFDFVFFLIFSSFWVFFCLDFFLVLGDLEAD